MTGAADVLIGVVPVVLATAFLMLIVKAMGDRSSGMVDRMKQAVGGTVMLLVALMVVFAFTGGGDGPGPDPEPTYTVHFYVATDSEGYGTVSAESLSDVPAGTAATVAQTIAVGDLGQCTATPAADTAEYEYAFSGWTGADDSDTPAPETVSADTSYYAHFTRTTQEYTVSFAVATDSQGYGTVSPASIAGVPYGTSVTVAQTIAVGDLGQCTATPSADDIEYAYAFAGWTGADDSDTPAPETVSADTSYYAHFTRESLWPAKMDPSLFTYTVSGGEATVTGFSSGSEPASGYVLYFPDTDGSGHPVTAIGTVDIYVSPVSSPWVNASAVRSDTATSIGEGAFHSCASLVEAYFPEAVTIGKQSFRSCTAMTSAVLPSVTTVGESCFRGCANLSLVSLPEATEIGITALSETGLTSVSLPAATTLQNFAFYKCYGLASVSLPAATTLGDKVFMYCTGIESVAFGPLATLGTDTFIDWTFYDTDGTTVLSKTAANLADSTFQGVYNALIKVDPASQRLTPEMERRALELSQENSEKASMLASLDPELADMDPTDVARMTVGEIRALTAEDVRALKEAVQDAKLSMLASIDPDLACLTREDASRMTMEGIASLTPEDVEDLKAEVERRRSGGE